MEKKFNDVEEIRREFKVHCKKYSITLISDRRQRSINFLMNCPKGIFYLYSIDASGHEKTTNYLLRLLEDAIFHVAKEHVDCGARVHR